MHGYAECEYGRESTRNLLSEVHTRYDLDDDIYQESGLSESAEYMGVDNRGNEAPPAARK